MPDEHTDAMTNRVPVFVPLATGTTLDDDGGRLPTVVIDTSEAPEISDLARVHSIEGIGDIRTEAVRTGSLIVLGIRMTVPVDATFAIAVDLDQHGAFLADVVDRGGFVIAHTDPERAAEERPTWLAVDIDGESLAEHLDVVDEPEP